MRKRFLILFSSLLIIVVLTILYIWKAKTDSFFLSNKKWITLETDIPQQELLEKLKKDSVISEKNVLQWNALSSLKSFETAKKGKYLINKNTPINGLINTFRSGNQTPIMIKVDGVRTIYQLAGSLGKQLLADSSDFIEEFKNPERLSKFKIGIENLSGLILPNVYDFYWTVSPREFMERMEQIHTDFWNGDRIEQLKEINLTKFEAITLASIVKGETVKKEEAPKIAGLYLNRLKKGMKLEADPTVSFAKQLKGAERLYHADLTFDSPYNTYKNVGLPPGPIFFTEPVYIEAVLDAEKHLYVFMCAQPGATGLHDFSETYAKHLQFAKAYHRWLNENNIR